MPQKWTSGGENVACKRTDSREWKLAMYRVQMENAQDGRTLAALMALMEREFRIPALQSKEYERKNRDVIELYRAMAKKRLELVW